MLLSQLVYLLRLLLLHAREFSYETKEKAVKRPPDPPGTYSCTNCLVALTTVEEGDNELVLAEAVESILDVAGRVSPSIIVVYPYAHLSNRLARLDVAHELIKKLAGLLDERVGNVAVHRAPFGWYKRFTIDVYGHPLSELSREITSERRILYILEDRHVTLRELIEKGYLPRGIMSELHRGELFELLERFGLVDVNDEGLYMINKLVDMILYTINADPSNIVVREGRISHPFGARGVEELLRECTGSSPNHTAILMGSSPKGHLISTQGYIDVKGILEKLNKPLTKSLKEVPLGDGFIVETKRVEGKLYLYNSMNEEITWPIGANIKHNRDERTCIGPVYNILLALIDAELAKAKEGKTPLLPAWIHPYHAAVIPVSSNEIETSRNVVETLASIGIRVYPLFNVGERLGARIRAAARRWIPYIIVIGKREAETGTVTVRRRWEEGKQEAITLGELLDELKSIVAGDPSLKRLLIKLQNTP